MDYWSNVKTNTVAIDEVTEEVYEIPAWTIGDLIINDGNFDFADSNIMVTLDVENLLDKKYYHAQARATLPVKYMQPPRTIYLKTTIKY